MSEDEDDDADPPPPPPFAPPPPPPPPPAPVYLGQFLHLVGGESDADDESGDDADMEM